MREERLMNRPYALAYGAISKLFLQKGMRYRLGTKCINSVLVLPRNGAHID